MRSEALHHSARRRNTGPPASVTASWCWGRPAACKSQDAVAGGPSLIDWVLQTLAPHVEEVLINANRNCDCIPRSVIAW